MIVFLCLENTFFTFYFVSQLSYRIWWKKCKPKWRKRNNKNAPIKEFGILFHFLCSFHLMGDAPWIIRLLLHFIVRSFANSSFLSSLFSLWTLEAFHFQFILHLSFYTFVIFLHINREEEKKHTEGEKDRIMLEKMETNAQAQCTHYKDSDYLLSENWMRILFCNDRMKWVFNGINAAI